MCCASQAIFKSALAAFAILALIRATASAADGLWDGREVPHTGEVLPGSPQLDKVDRMMAEILARHNVPGAGVAIAYHGRLVVARGYGWADIERRKPVEPETLFGLASISKSIVTVTVLKLVDQGRLKLDDRVFDLLGDPKAPPGKSVDPRLKQVTVRMLLHHAGGWDRDKSGDPYEFSPRMIERALKVKPPVTVDQLICYMNGKPLDFEPGTQEHYSNYGFMLAGRVIQQVAGQPYVEATNRITFAPMGIRQIEMAVTRHEGADSFYLPGEAKRYFLGEAKSLPGGTGGMTVAAGGWCGSAVALAQFLTALDGTRTRTPFLDERTTRQMLAKPEPPLHIRPTGSWFGLGWDTVREIPDWPHGEGLAYGKDGGVNGISTWFEHLPGGIDWVVLFNGSNPDTPEPKKPEKTVGDAKKEKPTAEKPKAEKPTEKAAEKPAADKPKATSLADTRKQMLELLRSVKQWPSGDLFEKFK